MAGTIHKDDPRHPEHPDYKKAQQDGEKDVKRAEEQEKAGIARSNPKQEKKDK